MNNNITFCIVDNIYSYANDEIKSTIRNICDYTISNLYSKGYNVIVGSNERDLLLEVETNFAVVMSPGTEYINGTKFFEALEKLILTDFFIAGHILDRTYHDAYYELHHQCYVINLQHYRSLNYPEIGELEYDSNHTQLEPIRSIENYHDDYTPLTVSKGLIYKKYKHRCHGWNLLRLAFEKDYIVKIFDDNIRNNKKHYYPENEEDFYKNLNYINHKLNYCATEFVHTENTESCSDLGDKYQQIVIPASGTLYLNLIDQGRVLFYDYNKKSLDYWKSHCQYKTGVEYIFVHTNLLETTDIVNYIDADLKTFVNLSNVFCYEGTAAKYSLQHRLEYQNNLVKILRDKVQNIIINFSLKADAGHQFPF